MDVHVVPGFCPYGLSIGEQERLDLIHALGGSQDVRTMVEGDL